MLKQLAEGKVYKQIAHDLGLSVNTVRTHLSVAYKTLGVADRAQAVIMFERRDWAGEERIESEDRSYEDYFSDVRMTSFMRTYCEQFDRYAKSGRSEVHRRGMRLAFGGMLNDAGARHLFAKSFAAEPEDEVLRGLSGDRGHPGKLCA